MTAGWKRHVFTAPGIGVALLPKLVCPMCWPAYASLVSSLGLGFLASSEYLLPLTIAFLLTAVASLAYNSRRRRGYGPFGLGLLASAVVVIAKFHMDSAAAMFAGIALLLFASIWNGWPRQASETGCVRCLTPKGAGENGT
jgi:mercuric ion transport protein